MDGAGNRFARARALAARRGGRPLRPRRSRRPLSARIATIALPTRTGLTGALVALALGMTVTIAFGVVLLVALTLAGRGTPALGAGRPLNTLLLLVFYGVSGWFALARLRAGGRRVFHRLHRRDVAVLAAAVVALVIAHILTGLQLVLSHQTQHVQAGFEHFSVASRTPLLTGLTIAATAATLVLLAPLVEEIIFRGLLFGALLRPLGTVVAALVSALLFGLVHGDLVLFPTLAALGLINALAYAATGNLTVPVTLHALSNALATAILVTHAGAPA